MEEPTNSYIRHHGAWGRAVRQVLTTFFTCIIQSTSHKPACLAVISQFLIFLISQYHSFYFSLPDSSVHLSISTHFSLSCLSVSLSALINWSLLNLLDERKHRNVNFDLDIVQYMFYFDFL